MVNFKRKALLVGMGMALSGAVYAGGGMSPAPVDRTGVYVEGNIGAVWKDHGKHSIFGMTTNTLITRNTALALGGDIGYMFTNYLGLELGGFWFQNSKASATAIAAGLATANTELKTWAGYLAAKLMVPVGMVNDNLYAFAKAGLGYQHTEFSGSLLGQLPLDFKEHAWVPAFAVGLDYFMNSNLMLNLQYMYLGNRNHYSRSLTDVAVTSHKSLLTVGVGYRFSM
jgi:opacity protein-like surface antigen